MIINDTQSILMNKNKTTNCTNRAINLDLSTSSTSSSTSTNSTTTNSHSNSKPAQNHHSTHVANQVVIIHQNNSISTNLLIDDLNNNFVGDHMTNHNHEPLLKKNIDMEADAESQNDTMNELKYMKGYVNVLKERFTRKSLGNDLNDSNVSVTSNNSGKESIVTLATQMGSTNTRVDYQKRSKQVSTSNLGVKLNSTTNQTDYQRRRSASPFIPATQHLMAKRLSNPSSHKDKKLFASSDDLRNTIKQAELSQCKTTSNSNSYLNELSNSIVKCKYLNEINKDELPRPNFVSSVKNLFEKQINDSVNSLNMNNSHSLSHSHQHSLISAQASRSSPIGYQKQLSLTVNNNSSNNNNCVSQHIAQCEHIIADRLKQNGTVLYEHTDTSTNKPATQLTIPAIPLLSTPIDTSQNHSSNRN